ncbi:LysR substrate-binding domain-containing protein [Aureimonas sp. SK2]|uniref:LysR substrate-binding domain-containing protein n=1 Tax=Aureimonas sp. SK2 TaxID=3015992 RepID=UPI002444FED0|nr:LysR substrate-binding domain-containing protein [Aureimonas sp. SK2]
MNLRQIEAFRAVMLSGTVSRAAELLGVTQPAVSRCVSELEARVGFFLFDRVKGRLVPTPEGQLFFREVDASFVGLDRLRASAARIRDFGTGSIRIASLAALGSTLVPRAIRMFREQHPHVTISLTVASSSTVRDHVAGGQYDIGLAADEVDLSGVDHQAFGSFPGVCAIPGGHPLSRLEVVTPADLDGVDYVALSPEDRARRRLDVELEAVGSKPRLVVETIYSSTICALALEGVGVGLVNPLSAEGFAERGVVFRPFKPDITFRSHLLFRPDTQKGAIVRRFTGALLAARSARPSG